MKFYCYYYIKRYNLIRVMKKLLFTLLSLSLIVSCNKESDVLDYDDWRGTDTEHYISKEKAIASVQEIIDQYDIVYVSDYVVKANTPFVAYFHDSKTIDVDSWVIMINTEPTANGGKYWRYLYVDACSGELVNESLEWCFPETGFTSEEIGFQGVDDSCDIVQPETKSLSESSVVSNNWAVIINGGWCKEMNHERYWNNCSEVYKRLRQVYGYQRDHIIVIMADGRYSKADQYTLDKKYRSSPLDLDDDGHMDVNYSATRSNISKAFDHIRYNNRYDDQVLVYITGHGGVTQTGAEQYFIVLWNGEKFYADWLALELDKLGSARKHVVLGQCNSGGFIGPLSSCGNITIATACKADQNSYSLNDLKFDSFLYHWTAAAAGKTPYDNIVNPEQNGYDGISMEEIFKYAKQMDRKEEIPQYCSVSESMGDSYGLAGTKLMQPELVGDSDISTSNVGTVSVDKLPALSCSIEWEAPTNVTLHPQSQNYVKLEHDCPKAMSKSSVVTKLTTSFKTYTLSHEVTLWRPGQHFTDDLIQGNLESGYFSLPFGSNKIGNYEWTLIDGCEILNEPTYFVDFRYDGEIPEDYYISVKFKNPFGEPTTIVRHFQ